MQCSRYVTSNFLSIYQGFITNKSAFNLLFLHILQFLLKKNSSAVFEELFLQRFDSLDNTVRNVLQTCALLGSEFTINDIVRVHPELDFSGAVAAIDAAVKQSILLEEIVVYEEPEMLGNTATSNEQHAGEDSSSERSPGPIWQPFEEKSYRFRHHIWQNCIPKTMLKERRLELHRMMAKSIEEDHMFDVLQSDISTLLQLLEHWKSCGEFSRVAPLALVLGNRMEELGSMQQSLDVCHGALHMLKRETGVTNLGEWTMLSLLELNSAYPLSLEFCDDLIISFVFVF